jgi:uncharacterized protein YodC (DUF2158 family)
MNAVIWDAGDAVRLKSGGFRMTVSAFDEEVNAVRVRWVDTDGEVQEAFFAPEMLVPADEDDELARV